ncbi:hypothetical protein ACJX0J_014816, partial [Zea mays]
EGKNPDIYVCFYVIVRIPHIELDINDILLMKEFEIEGAIFRRNTIAIGTLNPLA